MLLWGNVKKDKLGGKVTNNGMKPI